MKFTLISDMHIDFPQNKTPYELFEESVVIAGDTSNGLEGFRFLEKMQRKGFNVFACPGNHENYSNLSQKRTAEETEERFRERFPGNGEIEEIPIVLRNGWYIVSDENLWRKYMNDSNRCQLLAKDVAYRAWNDFNSIRNTLEDWKNCNYKGVVVTHTAPCMDTLSPKYEGHYSNEWYYNPYMIDLLKEYSEQIHVWCHGHTHSPNDKIVEGVRVVCNPRGYPNENPDWKPLTIEINT